MGAVMHGGAPLFAAAPAATAWQPPATAEEACERFYTKYGMRLVSALLGGPVPEPETIEDWCKLGLAVKQVIEVRQTARQTVKR